MTQHLDDSNIQCIKQLPIFDNAFVGYDSPQQQQPQYYKYISLNNILYIYESGTKLPIDLQSTETMYSRHRQRFKDPAR